MENIGDVSVLIGMAGMVVVVGFAWGDIRRQVHTLVEQMTKLQTQTNTNTTDIAVLDAIVKDRSEREGA